MVMESAADDRGEKSKLSLGEALSRRKEEKELPRLLLMAEELLLRTLESDSPCCSPSNTETEEPLRITFKTESLELLCMYVEKSCEFLKQ